MLYADIFSMNDTQQSPSKWDSFLKKWGLGFLIGLFLLVHIIALNDNFKEQIQSTVFPDTRKLLSTVDAFLKDGTKIKVVKIKTKKGIFLEIYNSSNTHHQPLMTRIKLPNKKDGFFFYQGQMTNLALEDLDGDFKVEILVPGFDENLVAHLNIYKFDPQTSSLTLITNPNAL